MVEKNYTHILYPPLLHNKVAKLPGVKSDTGVCRVRIFQHPAPVVECWHFAVTPPSFVLDDNIWQSLRHVCRFIAVVVSPMTKTGNPSCHLRTDFSHFTHPYNTWRKMPTCVAIWFVFHGIANTLFQNIFDCHVIDLWKWLFWLY